MTKSDVVETRNLHYIVDLVVCLIFNLGRIFPHETFFGFFFCIAGNTRLEPDLASRFIKICNKNE